MIEESDLLTGYCDHNPVSAVYRSTCEPIEDNLVTNLINSDLELCFSRINGTRLGNDRKILMPECDEQEHLGWRRDRKAHTRRVVSKSTCLRR